MDWTAAFFFVRPSAIESAIAHHRIGHRSPLSQVGPGAPSRGPVLFESAAQSANPPNA